MTNKKLFVTKLQYLAPTRLPWEAKCPKVHGEPFCFDSTSSSPLSPHRQTPQNLTQNKHFHLFDYRLRAKLPPFRQGTDPHSQK